MKFLKKFNTEEEYVAYLNSDDFVRPCVARIVDDKAVHYKKRYKNGVYIQHVDGKLFTTEQWTENGFASSVANGVALISENAQFVISKTQAGYTVWSSDVNSVEGICTTTDISVANKDFAGEHNTELMLATDTSGAGYLCANYTFPNGQKGYLPSFGEWRLVYYDKTTIANALSLIKADGFKGDYWSSTQYTETEAWKYSTTQSTGYGHDNKSSNNRVRAFAPLNY